MKLKPVAAALCAGLLWAGPASAVDITFDELAAGVILSNQYAALGVIFVPNAFSGLGSSSSGEPWATNTDMTIAAIGTNDVGGLGGPSLVSGNLLHSYGGWGVEDGDASFAAIFSTPITNFSADFAGVFQSGVDASRDVRLWVYAGTTLLTPTPITTAPGAIGQFTLSFTGTGITRVVIAPGSYNDWVGVDNIRYTQQSPVPEPESYALMALGLGMIGITRRRLTADRG